MCRVEAIPRTAFAVMLLLASSLAAGEPPSGVYAVWYGWDSEVLDLPIVRGGQAWAMWQQLEPAPGDYDFSLLEARLREVAERGGQATVQINANRHPAWLFERVPSLPVALRSVLDEQGTLMYWHPAYVAAHRRLIEALADWLRACELRHAVAGIRFSFNAIGTEQLSVPRAYRAAGEWNAPAGVDQGADWSSDAAHTYAADIVELYLDTFRDDPFVLLLRRTLVQPRGNPLGGAERGKALSERIARLLDEGRVGLFHTSTEIQPRNDGNSAAAYAAMRDWCRGRRVLCYAESWTDAPRRRLDYPRTPPPSAAQWIYWRLLADLHLGISMIAVYQADLARASAPGFREGLRLAADYAGRHRDRSSSPGAWIAFRGGDFLAGDYSFLADSRGACGTPVTAAGPEGHPFGLWARRLGEAETCAIVLDERFAAASQDAGLVLAVTVLAGEGAAAALQVEGIVSGRLTVPQVSPPAWQTLSLEAASPARSPRRQRRRAAGGDLTLRAEGGDLVLHLLEIRAGAGPGRSPP